MLAIVVTRNEKIGITSREITTPAHDDVQASETEVKA